MTQTELTDVGEQTLMSGVRPITLADRLQAMTQHPMRPRRNPNAEQKPPDIGLFDTLGRAQMDFADLLAETRSEAP